MVDFLRIFMTAAMMTSLLAVATQADSPVVINELLASNGQGAQDPQGEFEDWIELYNTTDVTVDVGGLYLTDDADEPMRWRIPDGTTISGKGYLVIWADNDVDDAGLHASFSLSSSGEQVSLYDADGVTLLDTVRFGEQILDDSYGRYPDGTGPWSPMGYPTPGRENIRGYEGIVARPQFSRTRAFYDAPIDVSITCATEDAEIYYTTDGSDPVAADRGQVGSGALLYQGPLRIAKTTCLRAAATRSGWRASPIETNTYLFLEDVVIQSPNRERPGPDWPSSSVNGQVIDYGMDPDVVNDTRYKELMDDALLAIPSISLVTDVDNLFDPQTGIYVNARAQGLGWERPASVELLDPNGSDGFQIDAGLRIRGGYSRSGSNPKHALRLFFRAEYGKGKLEFPLFDDEGAEEFDAVDLRTSQNYSWSYEGGNSNSHDTFVREVFSRDTQRDMDRPYTRSRYYHLYINGQYWGLYQTQERSEASYAETYFGPEKEDYDVIKSRAGNGGTISKRPTERSTPGDGSGMPPSPDSTTTRPTIVSRVSIQTAHPTPIMRDCSTSTTLSTICSAPTMWATPMGLSARGLAWPTTSTVSITERIPTDSNSSGTMPSIRSTISTSHACSHQRRPRSENASTSPIRYGCTSSSWSIRSIGCASPTASTSVSSMAGY